jgi:hypothetical protein
MHNTEDKQWWVLEYRKNEDDFVNLVAPKLGLKAEINPEKETNPFAPDLIVNEKLADLKCQQTPFFKSNVFYKIPNQYAVTFNHKDYVNYSEKYPDITIYYWIDWQLLSKTIRGETFTVEPMSGIWRVHFSRIKAMIETQKTNLHTYLRRTEDSVGNAKDSYVFDLRSFENLFLKEN